MKREILKTQLNLANTDKNVSRNDEFVHEVVSPTDSAIHAQSDINSPAGIEISPPLPLYVNTIEQTAAVLQISTKSVRRLISRNLLSASKGLRHIRITRQAISDYLTNTSK